MRKVLGLFGDLVFTVLLIAFTLGLVLYTIDRDSPEENIPNDGVIKSKEVEAVYEREPVRTVHVSTNLEPAYFRMHKDGDFVCTGIVIGPSLAISAHHCADVDEIIEVVSDSQKVVALARVSAALARQDLIVIVGNFHAFQTADFEYISNLYLETPPRKMKACGYAYGSRHYRCYDYTPVKNYLTMENGIGRLYYGMSGGPVFDEATGKVVGVNSAITDGLVIIAPLIGLERLVKGL